MSEPAVLPQEQQEQIADHHRRQGQGEVHGHLQQHLPPELAEGHDIGRGEAEGKRHQGRHQGNLGRQPYGIQV